MVIMHCTLNIPQLLTETMREFINCLKYSYFPSVIKPLFAHLLPATHKKLKKEMQQFFILKNFWLIFPSWIQFGSLCNY